MSYKPLENVTIVFSTANITVCADEWGDLYYTTEIPDLIVCWQFTRNCRMTYLST